MADKQAAEEEKRLKERHDSLVAARKGARETVGLPSGDKPVYSLTDRISKLFTTHDGKTDWGAVALTGAATALTGLVGFAFGGGLLGVLVGALVGGAAITTALTMFGDTILQFLHMQPKVGPPTPLSESYSPKPNEKTVSVEKITLPKVGSKTTTLEAPRYNPDENPPIIGGVPMQKARETVQKWRGLIAEFYPKPTEQSTLVSKEITDTESHNAELFKKYKTTPEQAAMLNELNSILTALDNGYKTKESNLRFVRGELDKKLPALQGKLEEYLKSSGADPAKAKTFFGITTGDLEKLKPTPLSRELSAHGEEIMVVLFANVKGMKDAAGRATDEQIRTAIENAAPAKLEPEEEKTARALWHQMNPGDQRVLLQKFGDWALREKAQQGTKTQDFWPEDVGTFLSADKLPSYLGDFLGKVLPTNVDWNLTPLHQQAFDAQKRAQSEKTPESYGAAADLFQQRLKQVQGGGILDDKQVHKLRLLTYAYRALAMENGLARQNKAYEAELKLLEGDFEKQLVTKYNRGIDRLKAFEQSKVLLLEKSENTLTVLNARGEKPQVLTIKIEPGNKASVTHAGKTISLGDTGTLDETKTNEWLLNVIKAFEKQAGQQAALPGQIIGADALAAQYRYAEHDISEQLAAPLAGLSTPRDAATPKAPIRQG